VLERDGRCDVLVHAAAMAAFGPLEEFVDHRPDRRRGRSVALRCSHRLLRRRRKQSGTTTAAYESWAGAPSSQRRVAFAAHQAALDQEERAGNCYESTLRDRSRILETNGLTELED